MQFKTKIISSLREFMSVDVVVKAPPKNYTKIVTKKGGSLYHDPRHHQLVHFPRKDAFEVTVNQFVVFSRLREGGWPSVDRIIEWALRVSVRLSDE